MIKYNENESHYKWVLPNSKIIHYYLGMSIGKEELHREDGPAIEHIQNDSYPGFWWVRGKHIPVDNQKDFEKYIKLMAFL